MIVCLRMEETETLCRHVVKPCIADIMSVSKKSDNSEGRVLNFCLIQFAKR